MKAMFKIYGIFSKSAPNNVVGQIPTYLRTDLVGIFIDWRREEMFVYNDKIIELVAGGSVGTVEF